MIIKMKKILFTGLIFSAILFACGQTNVQSDIQKQDSLSAETLIQKEKDSLLNPFGDKVQTRFLTPNGFERIHADSGSFAEYLRHLPLKPHNSEVKIYDGTFKTNYDVYDAVVNLEIGNKNLHQCADAVMRLRAEYLWNQKQYDKIHFNFTNGFRVDYSEWMQGKRIIVKGNNTYWKQSTSPSNTYKDFWKYMEMIFTYAGTLSLSKELKKVEIKDMKIGDIFIRGGNPGHAVIIVDMAMDSVSGKKIFLLAQSYMPAQEIQILKNPNDKILSPWYSIDFGQELTTPEWTFINTELARFED